MPVSAGLISTWKVDTSQGEWIGFQVLYGFSLGLGMQQAQLAAQTVLKCVDVQTGMALVVFMQTLGGDVFISVCQNVLTSHLVSGISRLASVTVLGALELELEWKSVKKGKRVVAQKDEMEDVEK
jgi:hypothetical protein